MKRPTLILCIDRDNDLYDKARISGPVVGRESNLDAVMKLSLADPEDSDVNALFYALKLYDQMKKDNETVEIVTLTGHKTLGYKADKKISSQLDKVVQELHPTSCILVSDGASDEEVLPIIRSRLKIDSTKIVFVRQAKELEKTYFVLLEKLKDPYYAKILIGVPALLILLFSVSDYLGLGWQPVGIVIGLYMLARMFSVDEAVIEVIKDFRFSLEKPGWIGYIAGFILLLIAVVVGFQNFESKQGVLDGLKLVGYVIGSMVWIVFTAILLVMVGKSADVLTEKRKYEVTKYMLYTVAAALLSMLIWVGSLWIVNLYPPYVDFGTFLLTLIVAIVLGYFATWVVNSYRQELLTNMKIEGKEAITDHGVYLGKIAGFDVREGKIIIQTILEKKFSLPISKIVSIDEKIVFSAGE
jgi:putative membrane protein